MKSEFAFEADLDENGILLFTLKGQFNVADWTLSRREAFDRLFGGTRDPSRPTVADISQLLAPAAEWMANAKAVFAELDRSGENKARSALIVNDSMEARFASDFYIELKKATRNTGGEIRVFKDFETAYAWATEGWSPPGP